MDTSQTPSFIIRKNKLQTQVDDLKNSLRDKFPKYIAGYSFKTNNLPWLISFMKDNGLWAEVVSSDEYKLAKSLEFPIDNIIFNGPAKGKLEFTEAVENGAIVNIDSKRELKWLKECNPLTKEKWRIGLRVNFCLEDKCPGESQSGAEDGRFGFSIENGELYEAIELMKKGKYPLAGIHLHCSSKTRSLRIYTAIANVAKYIVCQFNLKLQFIDVGGGFFGGVPGKPTFEDYFASIKTILQEKINLESTCIIVEPGISLVGSTIDYLTEVIDVKNTKNNRFVLLDGSRIHIDPLMRKTAYTYHVEPISDDNRLIGDQILCGFTCMENDRFFHLSGQMLTVGDKVVFEKVGAYTMGLSPQFIEAYPPVYVELDGKLEKVRTKQNLPI